MKRLARPSARNWRSVPTAGNIFSARTGHTVVHHDGAIFVFGGTDNKKRQQDLYKLDLDTNTWSQLFPKENSVVPWCRSGAVGVSNDAYFYLFGGYDGRGGNYFNDLYAYSFKENKWELIRPRSRSVKTGETPTITLIPRARTDHSLVCHQNKLYLFGGYDGGLRYNDLWCFDLVEQTWTPLGTESFYKPVERFGHSAVVHDDNLWIFGGWDGKETLGSLWRFDLKTNEWIPMYYKSKSKDADNIHEINQIKPNRSRKFQLRYEMQCIDKAFSITDQNADWPDTRYRHSAVVYNNDMYVFGGVDKMHNRFQDLKRFNFQSGSWHCVTPMGSAPSARTFHRAVVARDHMFLLGGYNGVDRLNDTHAVYIGPLSVPRLETLCAQFIRDKYDHMKYKSTSVPSLIIDTVVWTRDECGILRGGRYKDNLCLCKCLKLSYAADIGSYRMMDIENEDSNCLDCGSPASEHVKIDESPVSGRQLTPMESLISKIIIQEPNKNRLSWPTRAGSRLSISSSSDESSYADENEFTGNFLPKSSTVIPSEKARRYLSKALNDSNNQSRKKTRRRFGSLLE